MKEKKPMIAVVGPCAAGKSTLVSALIELGYSAKHVAQEHSYVPEMWQILVSPDILIYLDVSFPVSRQRTGSTWQESIFNKQISRLTHAREHADLILNTDTHQPEEILELVKDFLERW